MCLFVFIGTASCLPAWSGEQLESLDCQKLEVTAPNLCCPIIKTITVAFLLFKYLFGIYL